jgi:hypothetical protein
MSLQTSIRPLQRPQIRIVILAILLTSIRCFGVAEDSSTEQTPTAGGPTVEVFSTDNPQPETASLQNWRLPAKVRIYLNTGYDNNSQTQHSGGGSVYSSGGITANYSFGTPRFRANISAGASASYYFENADINPTIFLDFGLNHAVSSRLKITANLISRYQSDPDFSLDAGLNRRSGNFLYVQPAFSAEYEWLPRFSTVTRYGLEALNYDNDAVGAFQNRVSHRLGEQLRFKLLPRTTLLGDYALAVTDYDDENRDSITHTVLGGVEYAFSPQLYGSLHAGADFRQKETSSEENNSLTSPHLEATLRYILGKKTSVSWDARYSLEESDVIESPNRKSFRTGLQLSYAYSPRLGGNLSGYYRHDLNEAADVMRPATSSFAEDSFDVSVNVYYKITRFFSANGGFHYTNIESDRELRSYTRESFFIGLSSSF